MRDQQIYFPLPKLTSIRLLKIAPGNPLDEIVCELTVVSNLEHAPAYEALSYAWGDPTVTVPITCNGNTKNVTTNLAAALQRFRKLPGSRTTRDGVFDVLLQAPSKLRMLREGKLPSFANRLRTNDPILLSVEGLLWIDALCINQEDLLEKSAQVALMPEIYRSATRVIVWLGEETSDTVTALKMLSIGLKCYYKERPAGVETYQPRPEVLLDDSIKSRGFPGIESASWIALSQFVSLPWFSRGWIIQEVALSRSCVIFIGDLELDWKAVGRATYWMAYKGYPQINVKNFDMIPLSFPATIWELQHPLRKNTLTLLLNRTKTFRTTLPQDKIYSLQALATGNSADHRPDYSKPPAHVFRAITKSLIEEAQNLYVLSEVDHGLILPNEISSWVPTWLSSKETPADIANGKCDIFRAGKGRKLIFGYSQSIEVIYLGGIMLDSVIYCSYTVTTCNNVSSSAQQRLIWDEVKQKVGGADTSYTSDLRLTIGIAFTLLLTQGVDQDIQLADKTPEYYFDAAAYWAKMGAIDLQNACLQEAESLENPRKSKIDRAGHYKLFMLAVGFATFLRRIFVTATGHIGVGPAAMRVGDEVCILTAVVTHSSYAHMEIDIDLWVLVTSKESCRVRQLSGMRHGTWTWIRPLRYSELSTKSFG